MLNSVLHDVSNRADLNVEVLLRDEETGEPVDLSGHVIVLQASPADYAYGPTLTASSEANDGSLIILPPPTMGVFLLHFGASQMSRCAPINYMLGGTIAFEGETEQIIIGVFNMVEGWVR